MADQAPVDYDPDDDDITQAPPFGYMFGALADDPANRLADGPDTIAALNALGAAIADGYLYVALNMPGKIVRLVPAP